MTQYEEFISKILEYDKNMICFNDDNYDSFKVNEEFIKYFNELKQGVQIDESEAVLESGEKIEPEELKIDFTITRSEDDHAYLCIIALKKDLELCDETHLGTSGKELTTDEFISKVSITETIYFSKDYQELLNIQSYLYSMGDVNFKSHPYIMKWIVQERLAGDYPETHLVKNGKGYDLKMTITNEHSEPLVLIKENIPASKKTIFKINAINWYKKFVIALAFTAACALVAGLIILLTK